MFSRRERDDRVVRGPVLSCVRPCTSDTYRVITRMLRCFGSKIGVGTARTSYVCTNVLVSAGGFVAGANIHAFRTTTFLGHSNTRMAHIEGVLEGSVTYCGTETRTMHRTRMCENSFTVSMYPDRGIRDPAVINTRTTGRLLGVVKVGTSFILARCGSGVCVDSHSVSRVGIRVVVRGLNNNKRLGITNTRLANIAVIRTGHVVRSALSRVLGRKSVRR